MSPNENTWPEETVNLIKRLQQAQFQLQEQFTGRNEAVRLLLLAALSQEHMLLIGPPGTAKTEIITRFTDLLGVSQFHYLLTRFTEPSEIFGPLDLEQFQEGVYHIRTAGMLPEAEIAFLDEVFQGSSPILNTLLALVNERRFHNGAERQITPLLSLIGASNTIPVDEGLAAFADRFLLRARVEPTPEDRIDSLLEQGWELQRDRIEATRDRDQGKQEARVMPLLNSAELRSLHYRLLEVDLAAIRPVYGRFMRELRAEGVMLSDRRLVSGLRLVAAATLLRLGTVADHRDLWPLFHIWSRGEEQDVIAEMLKNLLSEAGAEAISSVRPVAEIMLDLETMEAQLPLATTEASLGAHLMGYNKLRRELLKDHATDQEAIRRVETAIQNGMQLMGGANV